MCAHTPFLVCGYLCVCYLFTYLSTYLSTHASNIHLYVPLSRSIYVCKCSYVTIDLSIYLSAHLYIYIHTGMYLFIYLYYGCKVGMLFRELCRHLWSDLGHRLRRRSPGLGTGFDV